MLPINQIICGDCLEVMKDWPDNCVDLVLTDPPYGVALGSRKNNNYEKAGYDKIEDTPEYITETIIPAIRLFISKYGRVVVTPGTRNAFDYPKPIEIGAIFNPAGAYCGRWGFTCYQPILYYGKDPLIATGRGCYPNSFAPKDNRKENVPHPYPKPLSWMKWFVQRCSLEEETILDPFCGSGTTCVAAKMLGRNYIGIDISEEYCEIARQRLKAVDTGVPVKEQRQGQMALFEEQGCSDQTK